MENYRLVALDLDGTLLNEQGRLTLQVKEAVAQVMHAGVEVILATGRRLGRTLEYSRELTLSAPVVVHNGAVIYDPVSERVIRKQTMDLEASQGLVSELTEARIPFIVYSGETTGDEILMEERLWRDNKELFMRYCGDEVQPVKTVDLLVAPVKVALLDFSSALTQRVSMWQNRYQNKLDMLVFSSPEHQYLGVEFLPQGCSKATGVLFVAESLGFDFSQVLAIGDDINDIELLQQAGFGVAMGNASPQVQAAADAVTTSNVGDGVAEALHLFVLGR